MTRIDFVRSQVEYYGRHLLSGSWHDKHLIHGLFSTYSQELRELEKENKSHFIHMGDDL